MKPSSALIVGAGISGLMAARTLRAAGVETTVLEKSRGPGGRAATRRLTAGVCDHGAQFFTAKDPRFQALVDAAVADGAAAVWSDGFPRGDGEFPADRRPRYRGAPTMNAFARWLGGGLSVLSERRVARVERAAGAWRAVTATGEVFDGEALFLSAPLPQSLALLDAGGVALSAADGATLRAAAYASCIALLVRLDAPSRVPAPGALYPFGGDSGEPLAWIADNARKGISPQDPTLTLHAGRRFSAEHAGGDPAETQRSLLEAAAPWIGEARVLETHQHLWRYSRPLEAFPEMFRRLADSPALYIIGDAFAGSRIEGAALSGLAAANDLLGAI